MKNEGFRPKIYGSQPLKMKVVGSHGNYTIHGCYGYGNPFPAMRDPQKMGQLGESLGGTGVCIS